jgi:general secretion pathway protein K
MRASEFMISDGDEDGFVLIAVIWIAGLLAVIATAFVLTVRSHTLVARNTVFNTKAEYAADGMARMLALKLAADLGHPSLDRRSVVTFCRLSPQILVAWRIQDQGGLVDINTASPQLIVALLKGLGLQADRLATDLTDFRDPDSLTADGVVEPKIYEGKSFGPKNAPFALTAELDQLPGADDRAFKRLLPYVTIQSLQQGFDPVVAPEKLLKLLGAKGQIDPMLGAFTSPSAQRAFSIDVVVEIEQKARFYRKTNIALLLQPDRPYAILSWEHGQDSSDWIFPETVQLPCIS